MIHIFQKRIIKLVFIRAWFLVLIISPKIVCAAPGEILTVAGNGLMTGALGDNGAATSAMIWVTDQIDIAPNGNLFIAQYTNGTDASFNRIRAVDLSTGLITTIAGGGTVHSADGVASLGAGFYQIFGLAVDSGGNIFLSDGDTIRKAATGGNISTHAGGGTVLGDNGTATLAKLYKPKGVKLDSSGNLYIADQWQHRIRKVDSAGAITTVAGNGLQGWSTGGVDATVESINYPRDVAPDGSGNLYFSTSSAIYKVDTAGALSIVAGINSGGYSGDGGAATAAMIAVQGVAVSSNAIYFATGTNHRVRRVDLMTGVITTVVGDGNNNAYQDGVAALSTSIENPMDVEVDASGNLYVAQNTRVHKITADTTAPTGSVVIDGGKSATNSQTVALTLNCTDAESACASMRLSNDGSNWGNWQAYSASLSWSLGTVSDGSHTVYVQYLDAWGNSTGTYSSSITLDTVNPDTTVITSPANNSFGNNQSLSIGGECVTGATCESGVSIEVRDGTTVLGMVSATDTVTGYTWSITTSNLSESQHSFVAVPFDAAGNEGSWSTPVVHTIDVTVPTVTAPTDIIQEASAATTSVSLGIATSTESLTPVADNNGPFTVGIHTITWSATDAAGNIGSATQSVTITDTTAPIVTAPDDITSEATGISTTINLGSATAVDSVDGSLTPSADQTGSFGVGTHTVTWSVTDNAGNQGSATQTVTVTDMTAPVVTPPADITVTATGTTTSVSLGTATATDLVDGVLTPTADSSGPFPVGVNTVTWSVTDTAGNRGSATQTVTVNEATDTTNSNSSDSGGGGSIDILALMTLLFSMFGIRRVSSKKVK